MIDLLKLKINKPEVFFNIIWSKFSRSVWSRIELDLVYPYHLRTII